MRKLVGMAGVVAGLVAASWSLSQAAGLIRAPSAASTNETLSGPYSADLFKIRETQNTNICDPDDRLVQKYKHNFVRIIDEERNVFIGSGLLTAECSKVITAGHTVYEDMSDSWAQPKRIAKISFHSIYPNGQWVRSGPFQTTRLTEGPWVQSNKFKDEIATLDIPAMKGCGRIRPMDGLDQDTLKELVAHKVPFFLLKFDRKIRKLCAQRCNILGIEENPSSRYVGAVGHDCGTNPGDSGAPIFLKGLKGDIDFLAGIHVGFDAKQDERNLFIIVDNKDIYP